MVVGCSGSGFLWFRCDVGGGIDYVVGIVMVVVLVTVVVAVVVVPLVVMLVGAVVEVVSWLDG